MSGLEFESRDCPACGDPFEALTFWDEGTRCGSCCTKAYRAKMAAYNEARPFSIESIGGGCPTQADGRTSDGRPYYFRARHGDWSLTLGEPDWPVDLRRWPCDDLPDPIASGDDPTNGVMPDAAVLAILDKHLGRPS